ncbi:MAG: glutathione S-transferase N-terminal domain-containing protein [Rhizobiales bacterium]|nr:glutathione S-transferase N-terminal domain-containing protein [Hyphomicrobiales bacterium]MBO6698465.1 glutathione S-transferase N-terminal domain-containing protein [Hyphomicrobiales bacterium]MBO6735281.1 glutathione S-transferase N-terminal domain-containing protein [Hyphomicrobiales bacterium]MBO6910911.1 glutathione S-transferase N-terminal domain-containing protein [Hyphomicrobiales bacterium]MBO6957281.1 glutathione S-transferase N-terminal domain-containing protein [Hyphomicrobiales
MRILYELCGAEPDRLFSAYSWRARLTLGFKELDFENRPTPFTQIPKALDCIHKTVPVLIDGETTITESFAICAYLEDTYPESASIFGGDGGKENAALIDNLIVTGLYPTISRMIILDIHNHLAREDAAYFRQSREKRFGMSLEDVQRGRDKERQKFATFLKPYRRRLEETPYLGGERLLYADIALAASFCWAKATSSYDTMNGDDLLHDWFNRVLDACNQTAALKLAA